MGPARALDIPSRTALATAPLSVRTQEGQTSEAKEQQDHISPRAPAAETALD